MVLVRVVRPVCPWWRQWLRSETMRYNWTLLYLLNGGTGSTRPHSDQACVQHLHPEVWVLESNRRPPHQVCQATTEKQYENDAHSTIACRLPCSPCACDLIQDKADKGDSMMNRCGSSAALLLVAVLFSCVATAQYSSCINGTITDIGNARCDMENNNPECGYDGGDVSSPCAVVSNL